MMHFSLPDLICWYVVFVFSLVAHEAGHALTAWKLGDATAYAGGQVTLNPIPHMRQEPFGTIVLPLLSFVTQGWMIGWATTPINRLWALSNPRRSALVAAAGPLVNLIILVLSFVLIRFFLAHGDFVRPAEPVVRLQSIVAGASPGPWMIAAELLSIAYALNLILFFFNLIPVPPLDGGSIIKLFLPSSIQQGYARLLAAPGTSMLGLLVAWVFFPRFFGPVIRQSVELIYR
jgi:Zn-dependent protease